MILELIALKFINYLNMKDCNISRPYQEVLVMISEIPNRRFITCNSNIVTKNQSFVLMAYPENWIVDPVGKESFICRNQFSYCELIYS